MMGPCTSFIYEVAMQEVHRGSASRTAPAATRCCRTGTLRRRVTLETLRVYKKTVQSGRGQLEKGVSAKGTMLVDVIVVLR